MNTIMNLLKWDLTTNKRLYSLYALGVFGTFFAIMIYPFISGNVVEYDGYDGHVRTYASQNATIVVALMVLVYSIMLTMISAPYDGKQSRISLLMLPATMKEKFIERLVFVLVVVPVALFVLAIAADVLHLLTGCIFMAMQENLHLHSYSYEIISELISIISGVMARGNVFPVSLCIMYGIMCGSVWTKRALPKSIGLGIAIMMVSVTGVSILGVLLMMMPSSMRDFLDEYLGPVVYYLGILLLDALMARIAYKVFVNRQVTEQIAHCGWCVRKIFATPLRFISKD